MTPAERSYLKCIRELVDAGYCVSMSGDGWINYRVTATATIVKYGEVYAIEASNTPRVSGADPS